MTTVFGAIRREPINPCSGTISCVCTASANIIHETTALFVVSKAPKPESIGHGKINHCHDIVLLICALVRFATGKNLPAKLIGRVARRHVERAANGIAAKVCSLRTTQHL